MKRKYAYTRKSPQPQQRKAAWDYAVQINMWSSVGAGFLMMVIAAAVAVR